ncbi:hypothetical protein J1614_007064 [Plenodomus biglobosus]|nr:hypothetical protein J1614_007064 [Plenodomus biglobosus]
MAPAQDLMHPALPISTNSPWSLIEVASHLKMLDLLSLSLTSKRFSDAAQEILYQDVSICNRTRKKQKAHSSKPASPSFSRQSAASPI